MSTRAICACAIGLAAVFEPACSAPEQPDEPPEERTAPDPAIDPSIDLDAVVARARMAFRDEGGALVANTHVYSARVAPRGITVQDPIAPDSVSATFATRSVARGDRRIARSPARLRRGESPRWAVLDRGDVVEKVRTTEIGVEQSWSFATRPDGDGDLVVAVGVTGLPFAGQSTGGLLFANADGGRKLRYGHGAFIDASGQRTELPARWEGDEIVLRVPANVVDDARYPAVIDPVIGPETPVDPTITPVPSPLNEAFPAVAFDGTNYLVVWQGPVSVVGIRIDSSGAAVDEIPFVIAAVGDNPAVAFGGGHYLVVWDAFDDAWAARVSPAGVVLDSSPIQITNDAPNQFIPAVDFDGTNYLAVWADNRAGNYDIYGARISTAGSVVDAGGFRISSESTEDSGPAIACGSSNCLTIWMDSRGATREVYGARVDATGAVLDPTGFRVAAAGNNVFDPAVAYSGPTAGYLAVWGEGGIVRGGRIDTSGTALDPSGFTIYGADPAYDPTVTPALADSGWIAVWRDRRNGATNADVFATRISSAGAILDGSGVAVTTVPNNQSGVAVASGSTACLIAWMDYDPDTVDIYAARATLSPLTVLDPNGFLVSTRNNEQSAPAMAFDGTNYLVVWVDNKGVGGIYGARVSPTGVPLDEPGFAIFEDAVAEQSEPDVAFDGTRYLVVWTRGGVSVVPDIYGARVSTDGTVLDPGSFAISTATGYQNTPSVDARGGDFMVAWSDRRAVTLQLYGARVSTDGVVLDPSGIPLMTETDFGVWSYRTPSVSADGTDYLVVSDRERTDAFGTQYGDIYGVRVSGAGVVLDDPPFIVTATSAVELAPDASFDGTNHLVVWDSGGYTAGSRVSPSGSVLDRFSVGFSARTPAVTHDGSTWIVAWKSPRSSDDIYASRVTTSGAVIDIGGFPIAASSVDEAEPAIAARAPGHGMIAYSSTLNGPSLVGSRSFVRTFDLLGAGEACTSAFECATGFCADGVCCQSACDGNCDTCAAGTGLCSDDDALCTGNCDVCVSGSCAADSTLCTGDCDVCSGFGTAFDCQADASQCPGDCETCAGSGTAFSCAFLPSSTSCRGSAGVCDPEEFCTGASATCPTDALEPSTTQCRDSAGVCDPAEFCTGSSADCPSDQLEPDTTSCRGSAGVCDVVEYCTGSSPTCPGDGFEPSTTACRASTGDCDPTEYCTGSGAGCPADALEPSTTVCRPSAGICDRPETCTGSDIDCPADEVESAGTICRAAAGVCDEQEVCSGTSVDCAADEVKPDTTVCRPAADDCDAAESCDGTSTVCPSDALVAADTVCRPAAAGGCDVAEVCSGTDAACPADGFATDGTACDDGDECTVDDACAAGTCVAGSPAIEIAPDPVAFPDTHVGEVAADESVVVTNHSASDITLTALGSDPGAVFPINDDPTSTGDVVLTPGATATAAVGFEPTEVQDYQGTLTASTTLGACPTFTAELTGSGVCPGCADAGPADAGAADAAGRPDASVTGGDGGGCGCRAGSRKSPPWAALLLVGGLVVLLRRGRRTADGRARRRRTASATRS